MANDIWVIDRPLSVRLCPYVTYVRTYVRVCVCVTAVRCVKCLLNVCELEIFKMSVAFFWSLHVLYNFGVSGWPS